MKLQQFLQAVTHRYIHMQIERNLFSKTMKNIMNFAVVRFIPLVFFTFAHSDGIADPCNGRTVKNSDAISFIKDSDPLINIVHIRVPDRFEGSTLNSLIFAGVSGEGKETKEISMPLSIKSKNGQTGSYFYVTPDWLKIEISAIYGDHTCSLELSRPYNNSRHSQP